MPHDGIIVPELLPQSEDVMSTEIFPIRLQKYPQIYSLSRRSEKEHFVLFHFFEKTDCYEISHHV